MQERGRDVFPLSRSMARQVPEARSAVLDVRYPDPGHAVLDEDEAKLRPAYGIGQSSRRPRHWRAHYRDAAREELVNHRYRSGGDECAVDERGGRVNNGAGD